MFASEAWNKIQTNFQGFKISPSPFGPKYISNP